MLIELSLVPQGAYPGATAAITRSLPLIEQIEARAARAGKRLSQASVDQIVSVITALRQLLDDGDGVDDEDLLDMALERSISRAAPAGLDAATRKKIGGLELGIGELLARSEPGQVDEHTVSEIVLPSGGRALMTSEPAAERCGCQTDGSSRRSPATRSSGRQVAAPRPHRSHRSGSDSSRCLSPR